MDVNDVNWTTASDPTSRYNCFGFVMGKFKWWQAPIYVDGVVQFPTHYWPEGVSADGSIDSYIKAAETEGFSISTDRAGEKGRTNMIMLYYTEKNREFQHAAAPEIASAFGKAKLEVGPTSNIRSMVSTQ